MKPDAFMPVHWPEFWQAVEGLSPVIIVAYLRAMSYYWHHNGCKGLHNDSEFLRNLCRCDREDWGSVFGILFDNGGNFFKQENGLWHQKRCRHEYTHAQNLMDKRKHQTEKATVARWAEKHKNENH